METLHLTRKEYDALIEAFPVFMRDKWSKLKAKWSLHGPSVTVDAEMAWKIRGLLSAINPLPVYQQQNKAHSSY